MAVKSALTEARLDMGKVPKLKEILIQMENLVGHLEVLKIHTLQRKAWICGMLHTQCMHTQKCVIMPELGTVSKWKGHGRKRKYLQTKEVMMYVPLLELIQSLLLDDSICKQVCMYAPSTYIYILTYSYYSSKGLVPIVLM